MKRVEAYGGGNCEEEKTNNFHNGIQVINAWRFISFSYIYTYAQAAYIKL